MNIQHTIKNADGSIFDVFITTPKQSHRVFEHAALKCAITPDAISIECIPTLADATPDDDVMDELNDNW